MHKERFIPLPSFITKKYINLNMKEEVNLAITVFKSGFSKWEQRNITRTYG